MTTLTTVLVLLVAVEHIAFMVLEIFFWTKPLGRRVFGLTPEFATASAALAKNQGLYNGFLDAGICRKPGHRCARACRRSSIATWRR